MAEEFHLTFLRLLLDDQIWKWCRQIPQWWRPTTRESSKQPQLSVAKPFAGFSCFNPLRRVELCRVVVVSCRKKYLVQVCISNQSLHTHNHNWPQFFRIWAFQFHDFSGKKWKVQRQHLCGNGFLVKTLDCILGTSPGITANPHLFRFIRLAFGLLCLQYFLGLSVEQNSERVYNWKIVVNDLAVDVNQTGLSQSKSSSLKTLKMLTNSRVSGGRPDPNKTL